MENKKNGFQEISFFSLGLFYKENKTFNKSEKFNEVIFLNHWVS